MNDLFSIRGWQRMTMLINAILVTHFIGYCYLMKGDIDCSQRSRINNNSNNEDGIHCVGGGIFQ